MMKTCRKCQCDKPLTAFFRDSKAGDGLQGWCKSCKSKSTTEYYKHNPSKRVPRSKEAAQNRYRRDCVNLNFARRVRQSLSGARQTAPWQALVPYTLQELKTHLEKLFTPEMSWANYGSYWHIDHRRPVSSFRITSIEDQDFQQCWALENLQPLYWLDNVVKSNHYEA